MAIFIPEWTKASGRNVHVKRALNALDDEHVVRKPVRRSAGPVDLFVQHHANGWIAIAVDDTKFAEFAPQEALDESPRRAAFEQRLAQLVALGAPDGTRANPIPAFVLMWNCSTDEVRALSKDYLARFGVRLFSRERFNQLGAKLIAGLLAPIAEEDEHWLLGAYFPEAEIPASCTTRRHFRRDHSATLGRYFLDRDQEWASKLDLDLPEEQQRTARDLTVRLINGVAGSGKTLIALNRALLLAELFPGQRLLLLIHNTPIVADIKERLHRAHGRLPPNLEISTFFGWVHKQWRVAFGSSPAVPEHHLVVPDLVKRHRAQLPAAGELKLSDAQLVDELDFINDALIDSERDYLEASRSGRGFALRPKERAQVWLLHEAVTQALRSHGQHMWSALPKELCLAADKHAAFERYDHILIDEAQFFAPSWFQLVKLALQPQGHLFLCADPNQGFMKSRLSWKSVGLDVAGRTKKLRRSYRTTRAILKAADSVLGALGAAESDDYLRPDFTGMDEGPRPLFVHADSPQDAMDRLLNELAAMFFQPSANPLPLSAALVIYGDNVPRGALYAQLIKRFGWDNLWWFNEKGQKKEPPAGYGKDYLRMSYLDSATGLEAGIVFLIGIEHLFDDDATAGLGAEERAQRREENARKLYMAMTRAGQRLVLISSQRLPAGMERMFDTADGGELGSMARAESAHAGALPG